jgi:lanosterol synthase
MTFGTIWKLNIFDGLQSWEHINCDKSKEEERGFSFLENDILSKDANNPDSTYENEKPYYTPNESLKKSIEYMSSIQNKEGFWSGDYGGPLFLLPGFLIVYYILGIILPKEIKEEMIKYILNTQNKKGKYFITLDGGWGLHIEDKSTIFGTVLNYLSLRLLGLDKDDENCKKARKFIIDNGKFYFYYEEVLLEFHNGESFIYVC